MQGESRFSGLCLGGPWDSKMHVHWSPTLEVAEMPKMSIAAFDPSLETANEPVPISKTVYDYVPITHAQGVWLHEGCRQKDVGLAVIAIDILVGRYTQRREPS